MPFKPSAPYPLLGSKPKCKRRCKHCAPTWSEACLDVGQPIRLCWSIKHDGTQLQHLQGLELLIARQPACRTVVAQAGERDRCIGSQSKAGMKLVSTTSRCACPAPAHAEVVP
jgi:hypothetical protein